MTYSIRCSNSETGLGGFWFHVEQYFGLTIYTMGKGSTMETEYTCKWCQSGKYNPETDTITCDKTKQLVNETATCTKFKLFDDNPL
jgi:hypothetical protein